MAKYSNLTALFSAIANSLRAKMGTSGKIVADDFPSVIESIETGITNVRIYKFTLSTTPGEGYQTLVSKDAFLASLYNDPNAFILMYGRNLAQASTSMRDLWFSLGSTIAYHGTTARSDILVRQSTSALTAVGGNGLKATNYNGHFMLDSAGTLKTYCKTDYPMVAGEYVIIAGTV